MIPIDASPVTSFPVGDTLEIRFLGVGKDVARRLRDLGIREGCQARVVSNGNKSVLAVGQARIALRKEVAMMVFAVPRRQD